MRILLAEADAMEIVDVALYAVIGVFVLCVSIGTFCIVYDLIRQMNRRDGL